MQQSFMDDVTVIALFELQTIARQETAVEWFTRFETVEKVIGAIDKR